MHGLLGCGESDGLVLSEMVVSAVELVEDARCFGVNHGSHEFGVEGRMTEFAAQTVGGAGFLAGISHILGVFEGDGFGVVIVLVIERAGAVNFEGQHYDW